MQPLITVESLQAQHAASLFAPLSDPLLYRYIPGAPPDTAEALATEFGRLAAGSSDAAQTWLNWIFRHEQTPVGMLQATAFADGRALIAYLVFRPYWGRGFGRQGCSWLVRELFERRGVREVLAHVDARHRASRRVLAATGLSPRSAREFPDIDPGDLLFGLSREDWLATQ
jgi:ribosomal-protein-alanine N-acetyltransferase